MERWPGYQGAVELVVRRRDYAPLEAAFYLTSGKLAKSAQFHTQGQSANLNVTAMTLQDKVAGRQQTRIHCLIIEPMVILERWFSPALSGLEYPGLRDYRMQRLISLESC